VVNLLARVTLTPQSKLESVGSSALAEAWHEHALRAIVEDSDV
jgi:hypothetical protein